MILGCNGPYPAACGATAGYLVNTEEGQIVLDMGSGVFERLNRLCKPEQIKAVVISHLHHDHIADLGVYNYYLELQAKRGIYKGKVSCFVPKEESDGLLSFEQLKKLYPYFKFVPIEEGKIFSFGGVKAQFSLMRHSTPSYGVRLTEVASGRKLVYSGDTNACPNLERLLSDCDLWLGGAPYIGKEYQEKGGHLSVEVMQRLAWKYQVPAILTHLNPLHNVRDYEKACTDERITVAKTFHSYHV